MRDDADRDPRIPTNGNATMRLAKSFRSVAVAALLLALTLGVGACGEGLTEVNENPNEPTDVPADVILPNAIADLGNTMWNSFWHMSLFSTWAQQLGEIQYPDEDRYNVRQSVMQSFWDGFYDIGQDVQTIADKGAATGNGNVEAVGRILKSYVFQMIVDAWGPAPYTEALKLEEGNSTPSYDAGSTIYDALLSSLADAQASIQPGGNPFGGNDLIYGGDMSKWKKLANSMRLEMAMRISDVNPSKAASVAQAAVSAGVFTSNADNAVLQYLGSSPNRNPVFENGLTRDDHAPSETLLSIMRQWDDPRIPIYAKPAGTSDPGDPLSVRFTGSLPGHSSQTCGTCPYESLNDISRIGTRWRDVPDTPMYFFTYARVSFYKAEAALRGFIGGSAQEYYEDGVEASLEQYGIGQDAIAAYMAQDGVAWGTGGMTAMEQIHTQKFIATYMGNAVENYAEIRRTGIPAIEPGPDATSVNSGHPPTRIQYPPLESSLNGSSYQEALSMIGGSNSFSAPIFWDPDPMVP